jgi:hypothetical protein
MVCYSIANANGVRSKVSFLGEKWVEEITPICKRRTLFHKDCCKY